MIIAKHKDIALLILHQMSCQKTIGLFNNIWVMILLISDMFI